MEGQEHNVKILVAKKIDSELFIHKPIWEQMDLLGNNE